MKNLWKILGKNRIKVYVSLLVLAASGYFSTLNAERKEELDYMSFTEMINSVDLGNYSEMIQALQEREARSNFLNNPVFKFKDKGGCQLETYRNKEVLLVTIPASFLFAPNETLLNDNAKKILSPFKKYLTNPDLYRVLLVMHTDNTGSEQYREEITEERVDSVFEWFEEQGSDTSYLFPYAMADELKLVENDSQENRAKNRRLEIYIMPGAKLLEQAKKSKR